MERTSVLASDSLEASIRAVEVARSSDASTTRRTGRLRSRRRCSGTRVQVGNRVVFRPLLDRRPFQVFEADARV